MATEPISYYMSRYSGEQIDQLLTNISCRNNQDLLDNSYFVGGGSQKGGGQFPINQRGKTEYSALGYTIDRYSLDLSPSSGKLLLLDDCVRIAKLNTSYNYVSMSQTLSPEINNAIKGKSATFSALVRGTGRHWISFFNSATNTTLGYKTIESSPDWTLISISTIFPSDSLNIMCVIYADNDTSATGYTDVKAAKLEFGLVQTLAHQNEDGNWVLNDPPPNKALELAKCQRYQIENVGGDREFGSVGLAFGQSGNVCYVQVPLLVQLRANPTVTYSGVWKLVDETSRTFWPNAINVTDIHLERLSANVVTLNVTAESNLDSTKTYALCYASSLVKNSLLFDSNL